MAWEDHGEKVVKPEDWNHYKILAVGPDIWLAVNGVVSVALHDPEGEKYGYIALQVHAGKPQTVQYRINKLVHNPEVEIAGLKKAELKKMLSTYEPRK